MSVRKVQSPWLTDVFTTANATPTISAPASFLTPANSITYVEMTAVARNTATNIGATIRVGAVVSNVGGVLSQAAITPIIASTGALLIGVVNFAISGSTIQPQVIGIVATSIEWLIDVRYWVN